MTISNLIDKMTLQEKASLLSGDGWWKTKAVERLGIPSVYVADGPHGLRIQDGTEKSMYDSRQAVCFPSAAGLAASFNREMLYEVGKTLANECKNERVDIILGPAVNMKRSPLCGRNFEYMSEDPYLAGQLASSYINGAQNEGVGVAVKHFAANNQEKRRMCVSAEVDERALREIYLAAFEEIVKSSEPASVMCSYNKINGTYSSENPTLLNDILRDEWGFDGLVMSDWGAVSDRVKGVPAGLDLEMPGSFGINEEKLIDAVEQGDLDEEAVDNAVKRVLEFVDKYTGFLSDKDSEDIDKMKDGEVSSIRTRKGFDYVADHKKARKFAQESMVLLKNDGALPLKKEEKILFVGDFARHPRIQGGGSSHVHCTKIFGALKASERICRVDYAQGYDLLDAKRDDELRIAAIEKAMKADKVVIFAGLPESYEHEGADREHMRMPKNQNKLIREIGCVNPNTVVVLHNGSPVEMPWLRYANSVLEAYLGGEACGEAVVDILFGKVNPSGKLAETFPLRLEDNPSFANFPGDRMTVQYRESIFIGYRYYDKMKKDVLFPFGHGLSYTKFEYSDLRLEEGDCEAIVSFKVKNTGSVPGAEVAQIYVGKPVSRVFRALRELKGFEKLYLAPDEEKTVSVRLNSRAFSYYDVKKKDWFVEPGIYSICVGASSRDLRLAGEVCFRGAEAEENTYDQEALKVYYSGNPALASEEEFEKLYGQKTAEKNLASGSRMTLLNTLNDCITTKWGSRIYTILSIIQNGKALFGNEQPEIGIEMDMPIGAMICMSSGRLTLKEGEAIVGLLNEENVGQNLKILKDAMSASMKKKSDEKKAAKLVEKEKRNAEKAALKAEKEAMKAEKEAIKAEKDAEKPEDESDKSEKKAERKTEFTMKGKEIIGKTKEFIENAGQKAKEAADRVTPKAKDFARNVSEKAEPKAESFVNNMSEAVETIIEKTEKIAEKTEAKIEEILEKKRAEEDSESNQDDGEK